MMHHTMVLFAYQNVFDNAHLLILFDTTADCVGGDTLLLLKLSRFITVKVWIKVILVLF